ncbi:MAG: hypothetical protein ACK56F_01530, partial [bacterium]
PISPASPSNSEIVIDDNIIFFLNIELLNQLSKAFWTRQHVRQVLAFISYFIDVEKLSIVDFFLFKL